jgi:hypothetical protein
MNSATSLRSNRTAFPNLTLGNIGRLSPAACARTHLVETPNQSATSLAVSNLSVVFRLLRCMGRLFQSAACFTGG